MPLFNPDKIANQNLSGQDSNILAIGEALEIPMRESMLRPWLIECIISIKGKN
jgi:hypothetical protein